jgi:RHS repeat-associated protein
VLYNYKPLYIAVGEASAATPNSYTNLLYSTMSNGSINFTFTPTQSNVELTIKEAALTPSIFATSHLCFTIDSVNYTQQNGSTSNTQLVQISSKQSDKYRFGYNGQEKDNEIAGMGNHNTAEFWEYDSRTGRRWNLDPVPDESESQYAVNKNNPIQYDDPDGDCPSCIIGGLIGAAVDYGTQVASNYIEGKKNIFTDNINLTSIGVAAVEGFVTSGASVAKNVGAKIAIKTAATIINNTVEIKTSKDGIKVKVEKDVVNIAKNSLIDATVDGVAKAVTPGAKTVQKQLSKTGFNKGQVATTVKNGLKSADVDVTRKINNTVKTGADKLVKGTSKAVSSTFENGVKAATNSTKDKVKEATNR